MIKLPILLLAISAVYLQEFDPEDAKHVCIAYSSDKTDKYAEKAGSEVLFRSVDRLGEINRRFEFLAHQGRCGHVYCPDEYICICNSGDVYFNNCHMRSLGVLRGYACNCPDVSDQNIIKNPEAMSHRAIKDYNKSLRDENATNQ